MFKRGHENVGVSTPRCNRKPEAAPPRRIRPCAHLNRPTMRWHSPHLPLLLLILSALEAVMASGFKICAYNVQKLDSKKASNFRVAHTLTRVVSRCDITLLQEVMDDGAVKKLLTSLNRYRYDEYTYKSVSSKALGNADNKQHYVFIYKVEMVNVTGQYQYQKANSFVREPFAVQFESHKTAIKKFVLVALHTEPRQAVQELDRLHDVFDEVVRKWKSMNVMFLGDFHAGCAYLTRADKKKVRLFTSSKFFWLIGDKVDTTVSDETSCAYDRIVVHGKSFLKAIAPYSAQVYNVNTELRLTKSRVLEISDHLPVQVTLKNAAQLLQATPLITLISICVIICSFLPAL
ncbi:deoxyribonuclease gamma-like isoform X3 [Nelusetta ayraudi]|uniref:deoxyribonuclease gamma-like isoform X3 n=1 Tax=Nelusetta ayraudi TaxID=303726 RepID=UPI003F6F479F